MELFSFCLPQSSISRKLQVQMILPTGLKRTKRIQSYTVKNFQNTTWNIILHEHLPNLINGRWNRYEKGGGVQQNGCKKMKMLVWLIDEINCYFVWIRIAALCWENPVSGSIEKEVKKRGKGQKMRPTKLDLTAVCKIIFLSFLFVFFGKEGEIFSTTLP